MTPERAADLGAARAAAVGLLSRRDFATGELRVKLGQQGFEAPVAAAAVDELIEGRILDDRRFAENFVSYHADRGQGPQRIAADLRALGVSGELIEEALARGPDWRVLAREVRIRRFGLAVPAEWPQKARQARFLQYRGFSSDHIRSALGADFSPD